MRGRSHTFTFTVCFAPSVMSNSNRSETELRATFDKHSGDDKLINIDELERCFKEIKYEANFDEIKTCLKEVDSDGSGELSFEEFKLLFSEVRLRKTFDEIDADCSGSLTSSELKQAFAKLDIHMSDSMLENMVAKVDLDKSGQISYDEFREIFGKVPNANLARISKVWMAMSGMDVGTDLAPPVPPKDLPLIQFLIAGGSGGCLSRTVTAPLERVRMQAQVNGKSGVNFMVKYLQQILREEGVKGLFAGNFMNCCRVFPFAGLSCVFYSRFMKIFPVDNEMDPMEPVWRALAGGLSGGLATILTYPMDVIRAKLTVSTSTESSSSPSTKQRSFKSATSSIMTKHGIKGFYRGMSPTLAAVMPFIAIQQASYDVLKQLFIDSGYFTVSPSTFFMTGALAGLCAQSVVYPLDVIRRRIQMDTVTVTSAESAAKGTGVRLYTWLAMRSVVEKEGFRSLFAGILPTMLKVAPAVSISVVTRDAILGKLG